MKNQEEKKKRANERLDELKAYYGHLVTYIGVNVMIAFVKIVRNLYNGETLFDAVWDFSTFAICIFWGIGLLFHTLKVCRYNPFYSEDWEKRQIEKYMHEERTEVEKYKQ